MAGGPDAALALFRAIVERQARLAHAEARQRRRREIDIDLGHRGFFRSSSELVFVRGSSVAVVDLAERGPVVLWGAGSKGMTYLNLVADVAPIAGVVSASAAAFFFDALVAFFAAARGLAVAIEGEWWRLMTSAFLHTGITHIALNMLALWFVGGAVEPAVVGQGLHRAVEIVVGAVVAVDVVRGDRRLKERFVMPDRLPPPNLLRDAPVQESLPLLAAPKEGENIVADYNSVDRYRRLADDLAKLALRDQLLTARRRRSPRRRP